MRVDFDGVSLLLYLLFTVPSQVELVKMVKGEQEMVVVTVKGSK